MNRAHVVQGVDIALYKKTDNMRSISCCLPRLTFHPRLMLSPLVKGRRFLPKVEENTQLLCTSKEW
jgi:hypothetical protein